MFSFWGRFVYRHRIVVLVVTSVALLIGGLFGLRLPDALSQSGYDDPGSDSTRAAVMTDEIYGRDHRSDVIVMFTAPDGTTVDDPAVAEPVQQLLDDAAAAHPDAIGTINSYWSTNLPDLVTDDRTTAFASVELTGDNDDETLAQYGEIRDSFDTDAATVQIAGLQPIGDAIGVGMDNDTARAELIALPVVAVLLFLVFGGVVAALLPVIIGVLTIAGATGAVWGLTHVMDVNTFAQPVVTLIGLGVAIDYGLFIVSRFREEIAEGYTTDAAVRRAVMTAGRTVAFSATLMIVSFGGLLMFPQGFLRSVALGGMIAIGLAAFASVTVLPAILSLLGRRVDAWGWKILRRTKTNEEIESGFWGRLADWVMKRPGLVAAPVTIVLLLLIVPFKNIAFGGLSETYLPPENPTRVAQETFDEKFPGFRTDPINLVVVGADGSQLSQIAAQANQVPGFTGPFTASRPTKGEVNVLSAGMVDSSQPKDTISQLRAMEVPDGVEVLVGGTPALTQDTIDTLGTRIGWMVLFIVVTTTVLMFLAFGSLVLPIKAVLMSALSLGSTLGILTWIFIDGHGASLANFTPGPLMAAVLVLLLAIVFGLSTDYEVFLVSRMVEARERGASTKEAIRMGTAHTGQIITAAALILIVVAGAFGFSEIVMMKYIAFGLIAALILDATVIRMLLVPSVMALLGDDCWWAPKWMKRIQRKIGLGEIHLPDERPTTQARAAAQVTTVIPRITAESTPAFAAAPAAGPARAARPATAQSAPERPATADRPAPAPSTPVTGDVPESAPQAAADTDAEASASPADRPIRAPRPLITDRPAGTGRVRPRRSRPQAPAAPAEPATPPAHTPGPAAESAPEQAPQPEPGRPATPRRPRPALEPELDPHTPPRGVRRVDSTRVDGPARPARTRVDSTRVPPPDPQPGPDSGRRARPDSESRLPSDVAAQRYRGEQVDSRPQPLYPWLERPAAPRGDRDVSRRPHPSDPAARERDREAEAHRDPGVPTADTPPRHEGAQGTPVSVDDLLRRHGVDSTASPRRRRRRSE